MMHPVTSISVIPADVIRVDGVELHSCVRCKYMYIRVRKTELANDLIYFQTNILCNRRVFGNAKQSRKESDDRQAADESLTWKAEQIVQFRAS